MTDLAAVQQDLKGKITRWAIIWGVVAGVAVALIVYWIGGNWNTLARWALALVAGGGLGFLTYRMRYNAEVAKAVCGKCGTAFAIREIGQSEGLLSSERREKIETVKAQGAGKLARDTRKTTTWVEEKYEITATDECFSCHNRTDRVWQVTREKDKVETQA